MNEYEEIKDRVWTLVEGQVLNQISGQARLQVWDEVWLQVVWIVKGQVDDQVRAQVEEELDE